MAGRIFVSIKWVMCLKSTWNTSKCYISTNHYFHCCDYEPSEIWWKLLWHSLSYLWESLKRESRLNIVQCWCISLLNETSHIFGSTDSCIPHIKPKMPWQLLFLGNCRIMCVVHFLYNGYKWKVEGGIKCYVEAKLKRGMFLKDSESMLYYNNLNDCNTRNKTH